MTNSQFTIKETTPVVLSWRGSRPGCRVAFIGYWLLCIANFCGGCSTARPRVEYVYYPKPPAVARAVHLISFNSLGELAPRKHSFGDLLRGGSFSPTVETPAGVAYRDGHLYVCDIGANAVHDWDLATGLPGSARLAAHRFEKPVDVDVDEQGTIFVVDSGARQLAMFNARGSSETMPLTQADRAAWQPVAVAAGRLVYVVDVKNHGVHALLGPDGAEPIAFGEAGSGEGQLYMPAGVAVDSAGNVYVSDSLNGRVQVFDEERHPIRTIGQPGDRYGDLGSPRGLALSPQGVLFIADPQFAHVHLFNTDGALLMLLGGPGEGPGDTPLPVGVAVAPDLPPALRAQLVPPAFSVDCFLFVTNTVGAKRISLYAIGRAEP